MTTLAIETATRICGAALVRDGRVIRAEEVDEKNVHAERLMDLIANVLREHGGIGAVEAIAVSIGPGSFTGLRIGVSVAKGLAFGTRRVLIGVPTLAALIGRARTESAIVAQDDTIVALLQARKGEYFLAREGNDEVQIWRAGQLAALLGREDFVLTGDLAEVPIDPVQRRVEEPLRRCSAVAVGLLGERLLREGKRDDVGKLEPQYALEFFLNADKTERT